MTSTNDIPCFNPARCGVKTHKIGSEAHAKCYKAFYGTDQTVFAGALSTSLPPLPSGGTKGRADSLLDQEAVNRINEGEADEEDLDELFKLADSLLGEKAAKEGITLNPISPSSELDRYEIDDFLSGNTNEIREQTLSDFNYSQTSYENSVSELEEVLKKLGVDEDALDGENRDHLLEIVEAYDNSSVDDMIYQNAQNTSPQLMRYEAFIPTDWDNPFLEDYLAFESLNNGPGYDTVLNARVKVFNKGLVESGLITEPLGGKNLENLKRAIADGPDEIWPDARVEVLWYGKLTDANLPDTKAEEERANRGEQSTNPLRSISTVEKTHLIFYDPDSDEGSEFEIDIPVKMDLSLKKHAVLDEGENTPWSWADITSQRGRSFPEYFETQIKDVS